MRKRQHNEARENSHTALGWIVRLRAENASDDDRQACARWLAAEKSHRQAMDRMLDLHDDLGCVKFLYASAQASRRKKGVWGVATVALAASIVAAVLVTFLLRDTGQPTYYQTAIGEQQSIELPDHSRVMLNTRSRIKVSFDRSHRQLELLRGEVFFQVAHDAKRPFEVVTGSARVTAIGTAFNIRKTAEAVQITVTEGVVRVDREQRAGIRIPGSEIVRARQQLTVTGAELQSAKPADTHQITAWQRGELVAIEMPLPALIRQIERYHDNHILLGSPDLAALTVSGIFQLQPLDPLLHALALSLDLQVSQVNATTVQLLPPPR